MELIEIVSPFICKNIFSHVETNELDGFAEELFHTIKEENPETMKIIKNMFYDCVKIEKHARIQAVS